MDNCDGSVECVNSDSKLIESNDCTSLPKYSCYETSATECEKQVSGNCEWTNKAEIEACINNPEN